MYYQGPPGSPEAPKLLVKYCPSRERVRKCRGEGKIARRREEKRLRLQKEIEEAQPESLSAHDLRKDSEIGEETTRNVFDRGLCQT